MKTGAKKFWPSLLLLDCWGCTAKWLLTMWKQVWAMPFMVTQASSVIMSSPSPTNGAQDLHENLLLIGDAAFPGLSNQNELNWTELFDRTGNQLMIDYKHVLSFDPIVCGRKWSDSTPSSVYRVKMPGLSCYYSAYESDHPSTYPYSIDTRLFLHHKYVYHITKLLINLRDSMGVLPPVFCILCFDTSLVVESVV